MNQLKPINLSNFYEESPSHIILHNKNFRSSNLLLNRIFENHNNANSFMGLKSKNIDSYTNSMNMKWLQSLDRGIKYKNKTKKKKQFIITIFVFIFN